MYNKKVEFIVGIFMLLGILSFLMLAVQVSGLSTELRTPQYHLKAVFDNIGDLKPRASVSIAGVKIGKVTKIDLDPESYRATVTLAINQSAQHLPVATSASIFTEGLLGSNYISLNPGLDLIEEGDNSYLKEGDTIETTYSAMILEDLIGKFMFNAQDKEGKQS